MKTWLRTNAANLITLFRLVSTLPLTYLSFAGQRNSFLILYLTAGFSDALDGYVARRLKTQSELGRKLDSLADDLFIPASILWAYLFKIDYNQFIRPILLLVSYFILVQIVSLIKFKRFNTLHLLIIKIIFMPGILLFTYIIWSGSIPLVLAQIFFIMATLQLTENLLILIISKDKLDENIISIFQLKKRRSAHQSE